MSHGKGASRHQPLGTAVMISVERHIVLQLCEMHFKSDNATVPALGRGLSRSTILGSYIVEFYVGFGTGGQGAGALGGPADQADKAEHRFGWHSALCRNAQDLRVPKYMYYKHIKPECDFVCTNRASLCQQN